MMKFTTLVLLTAFSPFTLAAVQSLSASGGGVEFGAIGKPSFIKINGKGEPAKGSVSVDGKKVTGSFEFNMASLDTGIDMRNEHMRDKYLQVKEHPTAKLEIKDLALAQDFAPGVSYEEVPFTGDLTLHGVTKAVSGKFSLGPAKQASAGFKIKLSDFKIDIPKYMGITVADEVDVKVKIAEFKAL